MKNPLGLERGKVALYRYHKSWHEIFMHEKRALQKILGRGAHIEHVGSTAVVGMTAKPIIDMAVGLAKRQDIRRFHAALEAQDYHFVRANRAPAELFYAKGPGQKRLVYLHVVDYPGIHWDEMIAFRDALRRQAALAKEYQNLKIQLAQKYPHNRKQYSAKKKPFILKILSRDK